MIYSASDGHGAAPLALTGLQRKHLQSVKVSQGAEGVNERVCVCARGQGDTRASMSLHPAPGHKGSQLHLRTPRSSPLPFRASPFSTGAQRC